MAIPQKVELIIPIAHKIHQNLVGRGKVEKRGLYREVASHPLVVALPAEYFENLPEKGLLYWQNVVEWVFSALVDSKLVVKDNGDWYVPAEREAEVLSLTVDGLRKLYLAYRETHESRRRPRKHRRTRSLVSPAPVFETMTIEVNGCIIKGRTEDIKKLIGL